MALAPSTANWHWKNKGVTGWGKQWFEENLTTVIFTEGDATAGIDSISTFEGDVEMGMRKSKLLTIYDINLVVKWTGTASDGTKVEGKLSIPEISHEITLDGSGDYQFDFSLSTSPQTAPVTALYQLTRKHLPPLLKAKFAEFPNALVEAHGKDLKVPASGTTTPLLNNGGGTPLRGGTPAPPVPVVVPKPPVLNYSSVKVDANLMASASDLYDLLTDDAKIPAWSRASAKSKPVIGSDYTIFGGNITGKYLNLEKPAKIVQTWVLKSPTWPSGHSATLMTRLEQMSDSTKVTWELEGVPKGEEDEMTKNLKGYYLQGFQSIGCVLLSEPEHSISSTSLGSTTVNSSKPPSSITRQIVVLSIVATVLAAAIGSRYRS